MPDLRGVGKVVVEEPRLLELLQPRRRRQPRRRDGGASSTLLLQPRVRQRLFCARPLVGIELQQAEDEIARVGRDAGPVLVGQPHEVVA